MKKLYVPLKQDPYKVILDCNYFTDFFNYIKQLKLNNNLFVIIDLNVFQIYKNDFTKLFESWPGKIHVHKLRASEKNKSFESASRIFAELINKGFGRDTTIVAIGGGITGDLAGFVAATYMRGVPSVQVPTTLLAAVDSSVGGKTAVNFGDTKNIVGAFYQPKIVLIDTAFFETLPREEIVCGLGELVKYAFITDPDFFNFVSKNLTKLFNLEKKSIIKAIETSVNYKSAVVVADEKETNIRKILNLGHTFAHAIEIEQEHKIKHGQAVILGIACAMYLSNKIGLLDDALLEKCLALLIKFRPEIYLSGFDKSKIYKIMLRDKKNRDAKIKFVMPLDFGKTLIDVEAEKKDVLFAIENGLNLFLT